MIFSIGILIWIMNFRVMPFRSSISNKIWDRVNSKPKLVYYNQTFILINDVIVICHMPLRGIELITTPKTTITS